MQDTVSILLDWLLEPFSYTFMQYALGSALIIAAVCAVLSCYLVLKGWSLMGDAISHAVLPGVVLANLFALPLTLGAFFSGLFCAFSVGYLKNHSRLKEDTIMGIVFSGMFAIGLVLFVKSGTTQHLTHILFGNILGISHTQFIQSLLLSSFILLVIYLKRRDLVLYCFDSNHAKVVGLNTTFLHYGLLSLLSLSIVSAMQVVGVLLVIAMLISPGITAYLLSKRFGVMLVIALTVSLTSTLIGVFLSYHLDAATGPSIVLVQALIFLISLLYNKYSLR